MKENFVIDLGDAKVETKGEEPLGCDPDGSIPQDGFRIPLGQC